MAYKRLISLLILMVFISGRDLYAGGWPQSKGGYFIKLSEWWMVSDQHFNGNGEPEPNFVEYGYYATSFYGEYGLSSKLTCILYFPFLNYTYNVEPSSLDRQSTWKTGDADLGLKYALTMDDPLAISSTLILGLPLGYNNNGPLITGDGEFNQILRVDAGQGFLLFKSNAWFNIYTGYNHRTNGYADEWQYGGEFGLRISNDKVSLVARLDRVDALGNGATAPVNPQSLFSNYREYLSLSPEISYHIDNAWGITVGAGTALLGKNIFASPSFTFGIFYKKLNLMTNKNESAQF